MPIRILLVDDHPEMRAALRSLCEEESDLTVVAEAADGLTAVRLAAELSPDVVVMDVRLPDVDGIEAARRIKAAVPGAGVVVLSAHADAGTMPQVLAAGARGFVPKDMAFEELPAAVRKVAGGGVYQSGHP